jgi:hypothetical protein
MFGNLGKNNSGLRTESGKTIMDLFSNVWKFLEYSILSSSSHEGFFPRAHEGFFPRVYKRYFPERIRATGNTCSYGLASN